jgi:hypothetical protein
MVSNRKGGSLDWVQTTGQAISPDPIKNEESDGGKTKSTFSFTMPESKDPITLKLTVGNVTQSIAIAPEPPPKPAPSPTDTTHGAADTGTSATSGQESLAERLRKRREALQGATPQPEVKTTPSEETKTPAETLPLAEPENVHGASESLNASGPGETALIVAVVSIAMLMLLRRKKRVQTEESSS